MSIMTPILFKPPYPSPSQPARIAIAALLLASLLPFAGCKKEEPPPPPPPDVEVVAVQQKDVPVYSEVVGSTEGNVNATISAQVSGYLLSRNYTEGSTVTNGQVLFQIDPAPFVAEVNKARSLLEQARATQQKYALDVQRYTPLAATEAISKQELDNAIQNERAAAANADAAKSALEQAQLNLGFTSILSPVDGVAGLASAQAQVGNLVGPASGPLTTVTTMDPMRVYFSVSQRGLTELQESLLKQGKSLDAKEGLPLELTLATGSVYPEKGQVRFRNNQIDVRTGTIRVVGEFPNPNSLLVPGMFVSVRATISTLTNALLVPQRVVTEMQGKYLIAVVGADNKVNIRPVTAGERVGSDWVISGDVKAGDKVVAAGTQKVRDGTLVNPTPFAEKSSAADTPTPPEKTP
jgi:membrane fusion protein (multidrug efflux system)